MPKVYLSIKAACMKKGGSEKKCKTQAAKIYQAMRKKDKSLPKLTNKYKK